MALDELISSAPATTRRKFVGTGVKIAYAAPVIAASFKIGSGTARAARRQRRRRMHNLQLRLSRFL